MIIHSRGLLLNTPNLSRSHIIFFMTTFARKNVTLQVRKYVVGVCGGAAILAGAGLLDGKRATCSKFMFPMLTKLGNNVLWDNSVNYVQDGKFLTTGGACAGLDGAFHLVQLLYGREVALKLAFVNEHRWLEDPKKDPMVAIFDNGMLNPNAIDIYDEKNAK